ncbi:MAG TPA: HD domain-containing protein [Nannocystaceae bacterium]|nr:HD domain-containing protein [Nannocystaceae bacterium]
MSASLLVKRALDRAAVWHRDQLRKYPGVAVPYVSHLAGVTIVLARHGFDDEVIAAGALHDAVEDTEVTLAEIEADFGARVAELVAAVSEQDKSLSWEERKADYLARFPGKPWAAQAITLADKIDNLQSILVCAREHGDPWAQFKRGRAQQLARFEELRTAALRLEPHPLIDEFVAVLDAVEREA